VRFRESTREAPHDLGAAALEVALKEALLWINLQSPAAETRMQTEPITTRVSFGESALQRTHVYEETAAQRELVYTADHHFSHPG
jgi:hypothetical protein